MHIREFSSNLTRDTNSLQTEESGQRYVADKLDLALLQFGPTDIEIRELSYRQVLGETHGGRYRWLVEPLSPIRKSLASKKDIPVFEHVREHPNPELVGYNSDDKVIIVVETPDSHLFVAGSGFRYFLATFEKVIVKTIFLTDGTGVPAPRILE